jgi:hypothetical protein
MSTQVLGPERSKVMVALVALALAFSVLVLASQARSIWSSGGGARLQPAPAPVASVAGIHPVNGSQIPAGCWVKYGCHRGTQIISTPANGGHVPEGCRVKYGC